MSCKPFFLQCFEAKKSHPLLTLFYFRILTRSECFDGMESPFTFLKTVGLEVMHEEIATHDKIKY